MAHAQKPDLVFQRNGRVHLYRRGCQFIRVLAFLECGSAENDCSNTGWTVPSQAEDCWSPTPFASFPFTSPVRRRVPPDSVSTLHVYRRFKGTCYLVINSSCVYVNDRGTGVVAFLRNGAAFFQKAVIFAVMAVRTLNHIMLRSYVRL